jgi:23S rRNA (guanosine2251-2'-O)-methyltransferase
MRTFEAVVRERPSVSVEELFQNASQRNSGKGIWLALDHLQDPHNVGAVFRAAGFFGIQGIILTQDRSAPLTGIAYDVASGGIESVPFTLQTNLQQAFRLAKDAGMWVLGTSEHAHDPLSSIQQDRPWLVVLGNEEKGMRRLTEESCDLLCRIPGLGKVTSLNVSVAAGVLMYQLSR